jgi:quercetin dioxygenase-like cupin family protein
MPDLDVRSFDAPDETRPFIDKGSVKVVGLGQGTVGLLMCEPGWRWSEHVKPLAGTDSCRAQHVAYCISGRMVVRMDDGAEREIGPGEMAFIPPGHDAWVVGDEPCVQVDFTGMADYAKSP